MNLKVVLKHLDLRNLEVYASYRDNEADRKELDRLLAYVLPLWISGTLNGEDQARLMVGFNQRINTSWSALNSHPELRAKLLATIGLGRILQHDFHVRKKRDMSLLTNFLSHIYSDIRDDEIQLWCSVNSEATLIDMCKDYGIQEKDREPIINEYRNVLS